MLLPASFHAQFDERIISQPAADTTGSYRDNLEKRVGAESGSEDRSVLSESEMNAKIDALPSADRKLAYMLIKRDSLDLATALEKPVREGWSYTKSFWYWRSWDGYFNDSDFDGY